MLASDVTMSDSQDCKDRCGELARNAVFRSYLGSGALVRAAFPVHENNMSQNNARGNSFEAPASFNRASSSADMHPESRTDDATSPCRAQGRSCKIVAASPDALVPAPSSFVPSEEFINKTMDRIASQARLDGQLLGGASTLEWPQISDGVQDGCLGDIAGDSGDDEHALKKQIEELRRTKESLLFQRDNNRRRGQYVLDTIYEENQQMLRQLDDLRSEYEIFAESTKNMQELFASRELVLRTVRATAEQVFQTDEEEDVMRIQILDTQSAAAVGSACRDDGPKSPAGSLSSDIATSPSPGRCRGRRVRQQPSTGSAVLGRNNSRIQLTRLVDVEERSSSHRFATVEDGVGRSGSFTEDVVFRCRSAECIR